MKEAQKGGWVHYEDYARLKAEVERLRAFATRTIIPNEELQAQVERLTKAGDMLAFYYISLGRKFFPDDPLPKSIMDWNDAKESKQS